jgi:uncharacterized protein (TIGR03790 family)
MTTTLTPSFIVTLLALMLTWLPAMPAGAAVPQFFLPKTGLAPAELAIVVNEADPLSRQIADYYRDRRGIPQANVIHVRFSPGAANLPRADFARIKSEVDRAVPASVQALVLTWTAPYRVDCMSITSAFAFGFDEAYCSRCKPTRASPYYNSPSLTPYRDYRMRPTIALAGKDFASVRALIDRGVAADGTRPPGTGYLVSTGDKDRNVRAAAYAAIMKAARGWLRMELVQSDFIRGKQDVLFYFTGLATVPELDSLHFMPGALADHLTSAGGQLTDSFQMSSLRWLEAGATGSYGAVVEPCNFPAKFPNPGVAIFWYLQGQSLIEAYWKSVAWPGEGIFIGEPLAAPFAGYSASLEGEEVVLRTQALAPGTYAVLGADSVLGPYRQEAGIIAGPGRNEYRFKDLRKPVYKLVKIE